LFDIPGCTVTPVSLEIVPGLKFDHWERIGRILSLAEKGVQWWIGDWIRYGEHEYGEKYAQAIEATGLEGKTLRNYVFVAEHVEMSRRRDNVDFSTHAEVAALPPEDQEEILEKAASENLTRRLVRREARKVRRKHEKPVDESAYVHSVAIREWLGFYQADLAAHDESVPSEAAFLRSMIESHIGQVVWQAARTIEEDCRVIRKAAAMLRGTEDEIYLYLVKRGYFMSDPDFEDRIELMVEKNQLKRKAEEGKKETQRGSMREIILPVYCGDESDDEDEL